MHSNCRSRLTGRTLASLTASGIAAAMLGVLPSPAVGLELAAWPYEWGSPGNNGPDLDLDSAADRTCFLTGIMGNLTGKSSHPNEPKASVGVYIRNGKWKLETRAGVGSGVSGRAVCIKNVANRTSMSWQECTAFECRNNYPFVKADGSRRCFLTSVWSRAGMTFHYNGDGAPAIRITKEGTPPIWVMRGWTSDDPSEPPNAGAEAYCVDFPGAGAADGSLGGNERRPMCDGPKSGSVTVGFLTGVSGDFNGGWSNGGVELIMDTATGKTDLKVTGGKAGYVSCVR